MRHVRAIPVDQGIDGIAAESLIVKDLPQTRVLPDDSSSGSLYLLCRLDAIGVGFGQPLLELCDIFSLPLPVPSLIISQASGTLCVLEKGKNKNKKIKNIRDSAIFAGLFHD